MSRMAKKPILIPEKVDIAKDGEKIKVKGPLGELERIFKNNIEISIKDGNIVLTAKKEDKETKALLGTYVSHIRNMIAGVTKGFEKKLIIEGIGFRAQVEGTNLVLNLGLSHPVKMGIPKGLKVQVEKSIVSVSGFNKETVGQFSANVRALKKPEPYKGKGIRYENEIIRRKAGKKAATTGAV
ncbi:MAG: large subunit ribosomal protein L6 [Parcubacteria group bacterium Athens0714_24]|nr:MAG: large subunit ribosomal protein L6 [Parcubacteria group bacterium Athens0714_24]